MEISTNIYMYLRMLNIGKYRSEVWDNRLNPVNNWWECYTQSIEEMEAMHAGYDFENPEEYFKEKGIDYAQALEQFKVDTNASYEAYRLDKFAPFEPEKWETVKKQFLPLKEVRSIHHYCVNDSIS